jgi:hypothetical protein
MCSAAEIILGAHARLQTTLPEVRIVQCYLLTCASDHGQLDAAAAAAILFALTSYGSLGVLSAGGTALLLSNTTLLPSAVHAGTKEIALTVADVVSCSKLPSVLRIHTLSAPATIPVNASLAPSGDQAG